MIRKLFNRTTGFLLLFWIYAAVGVFSFFYAPPLKVRSWSVSEHSTEGIWLNITIGSLENLKKEGRDIDLLTEEFTVKATGSTGKVYSFQYNGSWFSTYSRNMADKEASWSFHSPETLEPGTEWLDLKGEVIISTSKNLPPLPLVKLSYTSENPVIHQGLHVNLDNVREIYLEKDGTRTDVPPGPTNPLPHFYELTISVSTQDKETINLTLINEAGKPLPDYEDTHFSEKERKIRNSLFKKEVREVTEQGMVYTKKVILQNLPDVLQLKVEQRSNEEKIVLPFKITVSAKDIAHIRKP